MLLCIDLQGIIGKLLIIDLLCNYVYYSYFIYNCKIKIDQKKIIK